MLAAAKLLEPLAERVGHLEHVTQARSFLSQSLRNNESFDTALFWLFKMP